MSNIKVRAKHGFIHGAYRLDAGDSAEMPKGIADDLEAAGLVEVGGGDAADVKAAPVHENKMAAPLVNKTVGLTLGPAQEAKAAHKPK